MPANNIAYGIPIYIGPHNHVWKLGVALPGNPILAAPGTVAGSDHSVTLPTLFVDTSLGTTPGIIPLDLFLTPLNADFFTSQWIITALGTLTIVLTKLVDATGLESLVARLHMQIPHSIIGNMPGEAI